MNKCPILHTTTQKNEDNHLTDVYEESKNFIAYRTVCSVPKKDIKVYVDGIAKQSITEEIDNEEPTNESSRDAKKTEDARSAKKQRNVEGPWNKLLIVLLILRALMWIFEDLLLSI